MTRLEYIRRGTGDPVVLIHGIGHSGRAWEPVSSMLATAYDVICVDLAGHGSSPSPQSPHSYEITSHAAQLEELFDELGLEQPHVVGNSLGGHIALELGLRGSVRSVTALAPAGFYTALGWAWAGIVLFLLKVLSYTPVTVPRRGARSPRMRRLSMGLIYVHGERISADALVQDTLNMRRSPGFWGQVLHDGSFRQRKGGALAVPATIAWGTRDLILLPTQARRAQKLLPEVRQVRLKDCGHCPMLDDPDAVVRVVTETFARAGDQRSVA